MAEKEVTLPDIGGFENVDIIEVLVSPGDTIAEEDSLITLESDKATMEVPSPEAGKVTQVKVKVGDKVSPGDPILIVDQEAAETQDAPQASAAQTETEAETETETGAETTPESTASVSTRSVSPAPAADKAPPRAAADTGAERRAPAEKQPPGSPPIPFDAEAIAPDEVPHASPTVRRFARELGVDLKAVEGSGRKGRILKEDVQAHVKKVMQAGGAPAAAGGLSVAPPPKVDFEAFGPVDSQPLSRIQRIAGPSLHRNWVTIPHVTQHDEADITEMEAFRKANAEEAKSRGGKLTPLVFLIKACVAALQRFPKFNASLDESGETLIVKQYYHIGVAVDTPDGLVVPVIRDCDRKGLVDLAVELVELSGKARDKKLAPADMQGGCMSISSLGGIGGTAFTPIVNAPEVAILGVSRAQTKPRWDGEAFQPRLMLPLSLSYDHRVIDGADAARFTAYLAELLGDIRRLLL